jgi:hypothetical protein
MLNRMGYNPPVGQLRKSHSLRGHANTALAGMKPLFSFIKNPNFMARPLPQLSAAHIHAWLWHNHMICKGIKLGRLKSLILRKSYYCWHIRLMAMKKILLVLLISLIPGICDAQFPDLIGNWVGSENGYYGVVGAYKLSQNTSVNLTIVEQKDRLFKGNITYMLNGTAITESLAGVIGLDNKTFYIAELKEGYDLGTIISDNEVELIYLQDGAQGWASTERLQRIEV